MFRSLALTVALAPAVFAASLVDLRATPTLAGARIRIAVKQPGGVGNVRRFALVHEHPMHLFVVGDGLEFFVHEHPVQQPDGVFMVDLALPRPGPYMAIAAFHPEGRTPQMTHQAFTTGSAFARSVPPAVDTASRIVDGMRVTLDASGVKAGEAHDLKMLIEDAETSAPIADLEPYHGAAALLFAVSADMTEAVHTRPAAGDRGSAVTFRPVFPRAGLFKVWVQFQRGARLTTASFVVAIP